MSPIRARGEHRRLSQGDLARAARLAGTELIEFEDGHANPDRGGSAPAGQDSRCARRRSIVRLILLHPFRRRPPACARRERDAPSPAPRAASRWLAGDRAAAVQLCGSGPEFRMRVQMPRDLRRSARSRADLARIPVHRAICSPGIVCNYLPGHDAGKMLPIGLELPSLTFHEFFQAHA
jgi:hypothetical protein